MPLIIMQFVSVSGALDFVKTMYLDFWWFMVSLLALNQQRGRFGQDRVSDVRDEDNLFGESLISDEIDGFSVAVFDASEEFCLHALDDVVYCV